MHKNARRELKNNPPRIKYAEVEFTWTLLSESRKRSDLFSFHNLAYIWK